MQSKEQNRAVLLRLDRKAMSISTSKSIHFSGVRIKLTLGVFENPHAIMGKPVYSMVGEKGANFWTLPLRLYRRGSNNLLRVYARGHLYMPAGSLAAWL